jgi:uncharacterized protein YbjT (DUF2867 family)
MPVIVIGADTAVGRAVVAALAPEAAELRAFVSDPAAADALKARGAKVAVGDVSDGSHVAGAAHETFCAVLIGEAATDGRERAFADTVEGVLGAWAAALSEAGTTRAIWVGDRVEAVELLSAAVAEFADVSSAARSPDDVAREAAALESARTI